MKKKLVLALKIAITVTILYFIFRKIDLKEVSALSVSIKPVVWLLLVVTSLFKIVFQCLNWEYCLKLNSDYDPKRSEIIKTHFIGVALRFVIPGGHASYGKVLFLEHSKKKTLASAFVEKLLQTWTIFLFGSWAALFYFEHISIVGRLGAIAVLTFIPLIVYFGKKLIKNHAEYFEKGLNMVPVFTFYQALYVLTTVFQYFLIINQLTFFSFPQAMIGVPLILTANTIPITYSGLGLRETFALYVLTGYGVIPEIAVTASLVVFFVNTVAPALVGAFLIVTSRKK